MNVLTRAIAELIEKRWTQYNLRRELSSQKENLDEVLKKLKFDENQYAQLRSQLLNAENQLQNAGAQEDGLIRLRKKYLYKNTSKHLHKIILFQ